MYRAGCDGNRGDVYGKIGYSAIAVAIMQFGDFSLRSVIRIYYVNWHRSSHMMQYSSPIASEICGDLCLP